jgi:2-dehydro-3-deoxygluconokinase
MSVSKQIALFGEYLLRFSPPASKKLIQSESLEMYWAGSEANVAVSLGVFGEPVKFVSSLPDNELSSIGMAALQRHGVDISAIRLEGDRLGTFFYEPGNGIRNGKIIYDRKYSSFSQLKPGMISWDELLEGCDCFHWTGINAGISEELAEVCREALEAASKKGIFVFADCNHRTALWKYGKHPREIMPSLLSYCDLIVADMTVGNMYYGIEPHEDDPVESFLNSVSKQFKPGASIALTMRGRIAGEGKASDYTGFLYAQGELYESKKFSLEHTVERIGTGDAFMAGLIYGTRHSLGPQDTINFAIAAAAMKHTIVGDFNLASVAEIKELIVNPRTGTILR